MKNNGTRNPILRIVRNAGRMLNNIRLRNKILILYFFAIFAPIILSNFIFYSVLTENIKQERMDDISRTVAQISRDFRAEIDDAVGVSSVIFTDYLLNDILEASYEHPTEYISAYDSYVRRILNSYTPVYHAVQSITIYVNNPTIAPMGGAIQLISDEIREVEWFEQLMKSNSAQPILQRTERKDTLRPEQEGIKDTFSIVRRMNYFQSQNNWTKVLKIDLRRHSIDQLFSNLNLQGYVYLLNDQGEVEYSTDPTINWYDEVIQYDTIAHEEGMVEFVESYSTVNYMPGWKLIVSVSKNEILEEVRKSQQFGFLVTCIVMIIPTLVIAWIVNSLNVRLIRILRHMKKVKHQHFEPIPNAHETDEIGQLTSEFNRMTLQIKSLINDVYVADIHSKNLEIQRRQAQLKALQSQINPHFIFNALETIRMRSLMKRESETAKIIQNMAKLMRNSLTWSKDLITVREELELIRSFLEIQSYRFGDKLKYEIDYDETILDERIPKMSLLPFVENASIHGIESIKDGGVIYLSMSKSVDMLQFVLRDNGAGMSEQRIEQLMTYLYEEVEMGDRVGVQNVIYRLKLYYADRFNFHIDSKLNEGTTVRLEIPV